MPNSDTPSATAQSGAYGTLRQYSAGVKFIPSSAAYAAAANVTGQIVPNYSAAISYDTLTINDPAAYNGYPTITTAYGVGSDCCNNVQFAVEDPCAVSDACVPCQSAPAYDACSASAAVVYSAPVAVSSCAARKSAAVNFYSANAAIIDIPGYNATIPSSFMR